MAKGINMNRVSATKSNNLEACLKKKIIMRHWLTCHYDEKQFLTFTTAWLTLGKTTTVHLQSNNVPLCSSIFWLECTANRT